VGNSTTILVLKLRPLQVSDAAGLEASILPKDLWQPTQIAESNFQAQSLISGTSLSADGDIWRILFSPPSATPDTVWYPIGLKISIMSGSASIVVADFDALFELSALFAIENPFENRGSWHDFTLFAPTVGYDGTEFVLYTGAPAFSAYPPRLSTALSSVPAEDALGGVQLTVKTWNGTAAALSFVHVDVRYLGYPRPSLLSGGLYTPRTFFKPQ